MEDLFDQMPDTSRVWVYQSNRHFTDHEVAQISEMVASFVQRWAAHGNRLKAAFKIVYNQFILLAVDESFNLASGCSIDDSVSLIRELEGEFGVELLDRSNVAFLKDEHIELFPLGQLKSRVEAGEIRQDTLVFNNAVHNMKDFRNSWRIPARDSWVNRYFK